MRTRGMRGETGQGQDGARLESSTSEDMTTDQERSSVTDPAADSMSANGGMLDLEEPVLVITDKRIRNLMAQSTTEKMVLENTLKDLDKQAQRHREIQDKGEDAELLIERAIQLKKNVQKSEKIEQSLLMKLTALTTLLEMLNMDGEDDTQKKKGKEMSNRVTGDIEKYSGRVDTFQHENRATLMFAIKKKQSAVPNSDNSRGSSRNNSIERRYTRIHDHLKPKQVGWDDSLDTIKKFQEQFRIWICEATRTTGPDKPFVWNSLLSLLDPEWTRRLKETKDLHESELDQIFQRMDSILMDRLCVTWTMRESRENQMNYQAHI